MTRNLQSKFRNEREWLRDISQLWKVIFSLHNIIQRSNLNQLNLSRFPSSYKERPMKIFFFCLFLFCILFISVAPKKIQRYKTFWKTEALYYARKLLVHLSLVMSIDMHFIYVISITDIPEGTLLPSQTSLWTRYCMYMNNGLDCIV